MKHRRGVMSAGETAWAMLSLFERGIALRARGYCLGDLAVDDVEITAAGVVRTERDTSLQRCVRRRRRDAHLRTGHDSGCVLCGVPSRVMRRLIQHWAESGAVDFALGIVDECYADLVSAAFTAQGRWSASHAHDSVTLIVRRRITPRPPKLDPEVCLE